MSNTCVYKYLFPEGGTEVTFDMPAGAHLLHVDQQNGEICLWAHVNLDTEPEPRRFVIYGTGWVIKDAHALKFIGTVLLAGGMLVFHVFEVLHA